MMHDAFPRLIRTILRLIAVILALVVLLPALLFLKPRSNEPRRDATSADAGPKDDEFWTAPDTSQLDNSEESRLIRYGRDLIARTSYYLGPRGVVKSISNGMNCQNCHLDAGTRIFGNNYSAVASVYPKFRARSGTVESIEKRINDCLERSLNGQTLADTSREMRAMVAYMKWLGKDVPPKQVPTGSGLVQPEFPDRAADPAKGKVIYREKCALCHGADGQGQKKDPGAEYLYPPLWGDHSYNTGAGLYRLSRFAGYVKANMPFGVRYDSTTLTDIESWDVAAFVNSRERPVLRSRGDWPDISKKPFDHPFGPYADEFSEQQHKYGPFGPIVGKREK